MSGQRRVRAPPRTIDAFGNEVVYDYVFVNRECMLDRITWGQNQGAGTTFFAEVDIDHVRAPLCSGIEIGSQASYRSGQVIVTGANEIRAIHARAIDPTTSGVVHTRTVSLTYTGQSCSASHAPVRLLASIQETASGTDSPSVTLPAVTFEYGDPVVNLNTPRTQTNPMGGLDPRPHNLGWGYRRNDDRWPTVEAMMLDVDGDGLPDRLSNASTPTTNGQCSARWQRNLGPNPGSGLPQFGPTQTIALPRLKWHQNASAANAAYPDYEGCALNGQVTTFRNSSDANGICHNNTSCALGSDPDDPTPYCFPGGTECPLGEGGGPDPFRTYLAYRWLDMDADGLVDLVAAIHGDIDRYDVEQGNQPPFIGNPEPLLFGAWPACPTQMDRCKAIDTACATQSCPPGAPCTINPATVNACIAAADTVGCSELIKYEGGISSPPPGGGPGPTTRGPYTRCEGLYPWFIYKNTGNGVFASAPVIKYQPIPLESDLADSNFNGPAFTSTHHAILDIDGDGKLDALAHPRGYATQNSGVWWWFVWLGDGTGGFEPTRHVFQTRRDAVINGVGTVNGSPFSTEGLQDLNGDGLVDQWQMIANSDASNIAFNHGTRHVLYGQSLGDPKGELDTPGTVKPGNDTTSTITNPTPWTGQPIIAGNTVSKNRVIDVDGDGRVDIVKVPVPGGGASSVVHFNVGGQFTTAGVTYPGDTHGLERRTDAIDEGDLVWQVTQDLVDLDGDGVPESVWFSPSFNRVVHQSAAPPRLLRTIKNGRGGEATLTYASLHDSNVVDQAPSLFWFDGRPKSTPTSQWVVKSLSVFDEFAGTTGVTTYRYTYPRHGADDEGRYAFRGFEQVSSVGPSGAKTVQRYDFQADWSGRLAATLVHPAEAPNEVRSISRVQWTERQLFGGRVKALFTSVVEKLTCANGQTEATCTPAAAAAYTKTTTAQVALSSTTSSGGPTLLWQDSETVLQGVAPADGDRRTVATFALNADAGTYRLRGLDATRQHRVAGAWVMFAKTAKEWDSTYRVPLTEEVWFDTNDANRAKTRFVYNMATGNLTERWKPEQDGIAKTSFEYDSRKLFVRLEVNELGQQTEFLYEYGTGTKLETIGPNTAGDGTKKRQRIRIDGVGRTIEQWESISLTGSSYADVQQVATSTYVEANLASTPHTPASVTSRRRIKAGGVAWTQEKTELDGHGRPIKQTELVQGSAPADHVTTFSYRNDGTLQTVSVPDPTQNNTSTVTYSYAFDSLGRATSIRRPDSTVPANQSGVDIVYDGVTQTVTEVVGTAGGQAASTKTVTDRFGRLIQVHEQTQVSPAAWAVTQYSYGPSDLVATIVDPQGVTTALTHDFAGRRTQIARHGRIWKYGYDRNGNLTSEQVPGSSGPLTDPDYTTTIVYDALDRPTSKVIGQRALSTADQQAFGARTETFGYDAAPNALGRLTSWQTFAPGASVPTVSETFSYDAQGNAIEQGQTFNGAGYATTRSFAREWNLLGGPTITRYLDMVGGSNRTQSEHIYDARGLPSRIDLIRGGEPTLQVGVQTRNVAGLVTKRRTDLSGAMTYIEATWSYDKLSRVANQTVKKGPDKAQVVRQDLTYFGNDDPSTLTHALGASSKQFQFGYDRRHQLTSANETTTQGYFSSSYQYGTAGRLTNVNIAQPTPPPGSELKPRNVDYQYGDPDPERVTALLLAGTSTRYATYQFDAAGNQTIRCYGASFSPCTGESLEMTYDGNDRLRRAVKKLNGVVVSSEEYFFGNGGQRFAVVERDNNGSKVEMTWFIGDTQAHYSPSGAVLHVYSHLSLGTPVARADRTSNTTTTLEFQFHGLANNTIAAVSTSGTTNAGFSYSPFGEIVERTGTHQATHARRFNDKQHDVVSGLAYYGHRSYDPVLVGWTQADPLYLRAPDAALLSTPRRANIFMFSLHNPLRYLDPDGLDAGHISSYQSGAEIRDGSRRMLEADGQWTQDFGSQLAWSAGSGDPLGLNDACNGITRVCDERSERMIVFDDLPSTRTYIPERDGFDSSKGKYLAAGTVTGLSLFAFYLLPTRVALVAGMATAPDEGTAGCAVIGGGFWSRLKGVLSGGAVTIAPRVANGANHIFGPKSLARHKLGSVLDAFNGDRVAAFNALEAAAQQLANQGAIKGVFQTTVGIAGQTVTVRGAVVDGVVRVGTAFVP